MRKISSSAPICLALALGVGCSAEPDATTLTPNDLNDATDAPVTVITPEETEAEFQRLVREPLSDDERLRVERVLQERNIDLDRATFVGRMVLIDDVYHYADDMLASERVEKGFTYASVLGEALPDIYTKKVGGVYQMYRPYFGFMGNLKLLVATTTLRGWLDTAANQVENAADDCLTSTSISAMTNADWDTMGIGKRGHATVAITRGALATACPGSPATTRGCAVGPRLVNAYISSDVIQQRMIPGTRIGLVDTAVTGTDDASVSTMVHELLHVLGFAHAYPEPDVSKLRVPGTGGSTGNGQSIMQAFCTPPTPGCNRTLSMSADDVLMLDTLYSAQPGGSCNFAAGFEPACPVQCAMITSQDVRGDCCWCSGVQKFYVRSTFNANTYLCQ